MSFIKQIFAEIKNTISSKFILISAILIFLFMCIAMPIISANMSSNLGFDEYDPYEHMEPLNIDGQTIEIVNQFQMDLYYILDQQKNAGQYSSNEKSAKYLDDMYTAIVDYFKQYLSIFTEPDNGNYNYDYRYALSYNCQQYIAKNYILEQIDPDVDALTEAAQFIYYEENGIENLLNMTAEEKQAEMDKNNEFLDAFDAIAKNNDFARYVDMQKISLNDEVISNEERIKTIEASLLDDPSQEEYVEREIGYLKTNIEDIQNNQIPILDYRLANNVLPGDGTWQDDAIKQVENFKRSITHQTNNKLSEEKFLEDEYYVNEYKNYENYLKAVNKEIEEMQFKVMVAQTSLDTGKPDMSVVPDGTRNALIDSFNAVMLITIFAILVGGCAIATDFQNGTVRLLMIRPRSREKVFFSKYIAGLIAIIVLYLLVFLVTFITKGVQLGFDDYLNPNYLASGEVNFFLDFIGKLFLTLTSVICLYTLAFAMSSIIKNVAVAIIIPTIGLLGSWVLMSVVANRSVAGWLAYTPIPYLSIHEFFLPDSSIAAAQRQGMDISVMLGVAILAVCTIIMISVSAILFKKQDIKN